MGNRTRNVHNLIRVKIIKNDCASLKHLVPSILLSNTISLAPKIDEIAYTIKTVDADFALFTETWLRDTVPDISINIKHYQHYRRDRANRLHGGVCMYVKDSIHCKILADINHSDHEVLWANLRPKRLPRGISNIIVAVVYQPQAADDATMKDYLNYIVLGDLRDKIPFLRNQFVIKPPTTRDKRPSKIASVGRFLQQVPWSDLFSPAQSSEDKLNILTDIINFGLNTIMPVSTIKIHESDRPRMNTNLKQLISRRQKAFTSGNNPLYKILRNKVNPACKRCRKSYYVNKVKGVRNSKPCDWWREVKQICGASKIPKRDLTSLLHPNLVRDKVSLAENINSAFVNIVNDYLPLSDCIRVETADDRPISVTEHSVARKLLELNASRASCPDNLPNWRPHFADILNTSFLECKVPDAWKLANVCPLPKASSICNINEDLRPISLTPTLSKVAESFIIGIALKPVLLPIIDPGQFGFIPGSSTTLALISMFHHCLRAAGGNASTVKTILLDFRKAFDLVDHNILVAKLFSIGVKPTAVSWIIDFLRHRKQRVKLNNIVSDWLDVPAGEPQGTRLGPWLFLVLINDLKLPQESLPMRKFADDCTISEVIPPSKQSSLHQAVDYIDAWSQENRLQLKPTKCKE
ncbi:Hypothetical predicted protein, partial [Paramuricea clavata]